MTADWRVLMPEGNGERERREPLELNETLTIQTSEGASLQFEVVGTIEDEHDGTTYAVLARESPEGDGDDFIVTDLEGTLVADQQLAQEVLDDFLSLAQEDEDEHTSSNGESG
jgi:hypothetical protein